MTWLMSQAPNFFSFLQTRHSLYNEQQIALIFRELLKNGIVLVVEKEGNVVGALGATVGGHPYNPTLLSAFEVFWWVEEKHRDSRAGILLFNEYIRFSKERECKMVHISKLEHSPFKEEFLVKKGFSLVEKAYLMEF